MDLLNATLVFHDEKLSVKMVPQRLGKGFDF